MLTSVFARSASEALSLELFDSLQYSCNLGVDSRGKVNTLVSLREKLDLFVSSLLIKLSQILSL